MVRLSFIMRFGRNAEKVLIKKLKFQNFLSNGVLMVKRLNPVVLAVLFLTSWHQLCRRKVIAASLPADAVELNRDRLSPRKGTLRGFCGEPELA